MNIDPEFVSPSTIYSTMIRAINPRPIAWVSTISQKGITNLAPFSYFNGVCSQPAALMISPVNKPDGTKKDTVRNIETTRQFVVNVVPFGQAASMAKTAGEFEFEESEFEVANLTPKPSLKIEPPGVAESPIQFECELMQIVKIGDGPLAANAVFGKILLIQIADEILNGEGKIDPEKLDTVGRMGGQDYCRSLDRFHLPRG
ncbi:MAG: flavin reductase family protein [Planctomycetota bacterium]